MIKTKSKRNGIVMPCHKSMIAISCHIKLKIECSKCDIPKKAYINKLKK